MSTQNPTAVCYDMGQGCVAVITGSNAPDVLSHAAVRARNSKVLLAACADAVAVDMLRSLEGSCVSLKPNQVCED